MNMLIFDKLTSNLNLDFINAAADISMEVNLAFDSIYLLGSPINLDNDLWSPVVSLVYVCHM